MHYKNRLFEDLCVLYWSKSAFFGVPVFAQLGTFLGFILFSEILKTLFFCKLIFIFKKMSEMCFKITIKIFFKNVFFQKHKNHW